MMKLKKTVYIATFVSLAAQIHFNFITDGFIIAMSILVMGIFIYCYKDLSPLYIAVCSGIFSPLLRMLFMMIEEGSPGLTALRTLPDMAFFFSYGILYTLIYKYIVKEPSTIRNFPYVAFSCDFISNAVELSMRSLIHGEFLFTVGTIISLFIIALVRTLLLRIILLAMEAYSNLLVKGEQDREFQRLAVQASVFESELHVMEKNAAEIEDIMRQAYSLYKAMEQLDIPKELRSQSLDISKNAHEVKGGYQGIISVLKDTFLDDIGKRGLSISEIAAIEKSSLESIMKQRGYNARLSVNIQSEFFVPQYFKIMSIMRNLLLNAAEAIGTGGGHIVLSVQEDEKHYVLSVWDSGPGLDTEQLETIFFDGYSTKFNAQTGNIQRGLGLTLVKDYVENIFCGTLQVESEKGKFTQFTVKIPKTVFEEEADEILYRG
ncbi:MAG: hypothetical protein HFE76_05900 [Firmicutes bacterium]|nr:hypothetical protein [Bacillota bacterium]